jgi:hypothetical protein
MSYVASDFFNNIAQNRYTSIGAWSKIGFNDNVDNAEEDLMPLGALYTFPADATKMDLVSSDAGDDGSPVGLGARTVTVYGLDATFAEISETITLNGVGPVQTVGTYLRINNMRVATAGTGGVPIGNLTLSETGGTTYKYGYIRAGYTRHRQMIYTVPLGKTLYISSASISAVNAAVSHWGRFTLRANYDEKSGLVLATTLFMPFFELLVVDQTVELAFEIPLRFPATTSLRMIVISDGASANEIMSAILRGYLTTP